MPRNPNIKKPKIESVILQNAKSKFIWDHRPYEYYLDKKLGRPPCAQSGKNSAQRSTMQHGFSRMAEAGKAAIVRAGQGRRSHRHSRRRLILLDQTARLRKREWHRLNWAERAAARALKPDQIAALEGLGYAVGPQKDWPAILENSQKRHAAACDLYQLVRDPNLPREAELEMVVPMGEGPMV